MGSSGGDVERITAGGKALTATGKDICASGHGVGDSSRAAVDGAGGSPVATAMERFAAAYSPYLDGIGGQVDALGLLASVTGQDIAAATGEGGGAT